MAEILKLELGAGPLGRFDKELHRIVPEEHSLSRSRVAALIRGGAVQDEAGAVLSDPGMKAVPHLALTLTLPDPEPDQVQPEAIPLDIVHEDAAVLIVNKPAGMVVHPAPGALCGTLVAALLHHCGESLSGIGGVARPGIVHRIDKDTSGLMVVAKSDAAHHSLSEQFAAHTVARRYRAFAHGIPDLSSPRLVNHPAVTVEEGGVLRIEGDIARHKVDRKRMAVVEGGRHAVTRATLVRRFKAGSEVTCQLETGRTHQIRVHMAHIGHPLIGDPVYGRKKDDFGRQALHAEHLGFVHPTSGDWIAYDAPLPEDMAALATNLG